MPAAQSTGAAKHKGVLQSTKGCCKAQRGAAKHKGVLQSTKGCCKAQRGAAKHVKLMVKMALCVQANGDADVWCSELHIFKCVFLFAITLWSVCDFL